MKTIIQQIDEAVEFYNFKAFEFKRKDFNEFCARIINDFNSLINGRSLLPANYLDELSGIPCDKIGCCGLTYFVPKGEVGLSYTQMVNYLKRYAKTLKHLAKPYKISNTK